MNGSSGKTTGEGAGSGKAGAIPSSAESLRILKIVTAMNLVRMSVGMYPPGHMQITQCIDSAFALVQEMLLERGELFIGFAGDEVSFGETAPDKMRENAAFKDYARCLNNLRIVSFTIHRGLTREAIAEFNRILTVKPSDIWALGKIASVFARAGVTGIKVKVIDADHFRLWEKQNILPDDADKKVFNENFWEDFFARLKAGAERKGGGEGIPREKDEIDPVEAVRVVNRQPEQWSSAIISYENMVSEYFSDASKGGLIGPDRLETLTMVNSLVADLHPQLKKQLIEVAERQFSLHEGTTLTEESLKGFPRDIFLEIIRKKNEQETEISPTLVNLLKRMAGIHDESQHPDVLAIRDFSSEDMETLFKREEYENYVPSDYDKLLRSASAASSADGRADDSVFPLQEHIETLANDYVDFRICQAILSLMEGELGEEEYLACTRKLALSIPELLETGRFAFLTDLVVILRGHARAKSGEAERSEALSILKSLSERGTVARAVTPHIVGEKADTAALAAFLVASGDQNLTWLFDLYLETKPDASAPVTGIIKAFGRKATDEALTRLSSKDSGTIVRLLAFIRLMDDRSVVSSLKPVIRHPEWPVRREVIRTLIQFDHPATVGLLRRSLKSEDHKEVADAVRLACGYRVGELLEDLVSILKTAVIGEKDAPLYEWIVGELAKTGNPSVIPHLERLESTWFTLSPARLERLKAVLYRHLHRFPREKVLKLLKKGSASRSKEIRMLSAKILKGGE